MLFNTIYVYTSVIRWIRGFFFSKIKRKFSININSALEMVNCKIYFDLVKMFFLRLFKMAKNQTECFWSVIKLLVAEKSKSFKIYERMCNMYGEACFSQKIVYKWVTHEFVNMSLSQKDSLPSSLQKKSSWLSC